MGIDERRRQEPPGGVELDEFPGGRSPGGADRGDPVALDEDVDEATGRRFFAPGGRVPTRVSDEQTRGRDSLPSRRCAS
jgi:hypothetical protein